jgi:hypothetical protein
MQVFNKINKYKKSTAISLLAVFMLQILVPLNSFALTGGPSQPEVQSFQPIGVSDMVDPFSGDFSYNLPLLDIDGYPINIVYNSGVTTDAEASWVGLGWNINPGVINRNMRGLPDDFNGDIVTKDLNMLPNKTLGVSGKFGGEFLGIENNKLISGNYGLGVTYNNYNGIGLEWTINASISSGKSAKGRGTLGLGIASSSENGLTISPNASYQSKISENDGRDKFLGLGVGSSFNSRAGLGELSITAKATNDISKTTVGQKNFSSAYKGFASLYDQTAGNVIGGGLGSSISFGINNYSPTGENPMVNYSVSFSYKFGTSNFGVDNTANFSGYYSVQKLKSNSIANPAYGYLNMQNAPLEGSANNSLLDFNREKDASFNVNTANLPLSNYTYDILSINGHGIGGSFRPFRNEVGAVGDPMHRNTSAGGSLGGEAGGGNLLKIGLDLHVNYTNSQSNIWDDQNLAKSNLKFRNSILNSEGSYEPVFYKQTGELSVDDESEFSDKFLKDKPIKIVLEKSGKKVFAKKEFADKYGNVYPISDEMYRKKRVKRGQVLTYLKRDELSRYALVDYSNKLYSAPGHHISEVSVIRTDGARYYYGIPAYNLFQQQTTFAMGTGGNNEDVKNLYNPKQKVANHDKGLIRYGDKDNSLGNNRGINHYYNSEKTPAYAHSYLLTAIVSPEYVDVDGIRGPSKGDIGNYTLFEYKKLSKPYKWRVPFENYQANYNEGLKSDNTDDQGNYQYGEKEIWYLEKIITKNTIAIFKTEPRNDAYSVNDKNGGIGPASISMHLLRKISLYSKPDYEMDSLAAIPIKEVHFEYDYSLCKGVPNNILNTYSSPVNSGKLTLKGIYFTYGKSYRAKFSPYSFDYGSFNPNYNLKDYDRWGNYKPSANGTFDPSGGILTSEYPYVNQDKTDADQNSSAWNLSTITLPSSGKIKVHYEADDYAYVQNKKAMQMFKIHSVAHTLNTVPPTWPATTDYQFISDFFDPANANLMEPYLAANSNRSNQYLTFKLEEEIPSTLTQTEADNYLYDKYLKGINQLYFRVLGNITNTNVNNNHYEYVSGYATIQQYGVRSCNPVGSGNYNFFYVKLKNVAIGDNSSTTNVNPISKAIWQFGRVHCPRIVNDQPTNEEPGDNVIKFVKTIANSIKPLYEGFFGANRVLQNKNYGKHIILDKSFIRFNTPSGFKYGGGSRVKKIEISDEWASMMPGNPTYSYGQEYTYTTLDQNTNEVISSGVASYEPAIGGDENPWKQPKWAGDEDEKLFVPDDRTYTEEPFGESFFPTPSVGYSKVTVRNLQYTGVKRHATGYIVNEFYTAKDFPTIVDFTPLDFKSYKTNKLWQILNKSSLDYMTTSQGYVIELNDMHGKQKANWVYAEDSDKPISGMEYKYNCIPYETTSFKLKNDALTITKEGKTAQKEIGVEYDMFVDFREDNSKIYGGGTDMNTAGFLAALFPAMVPTVLPEYNKEETRYRSAVITKLVYRYGLVKETIAYDLGSSVPTKNLAYDAESGQVLLTMTKNEFEDDIYNFQYPAHWFYEEMGAAYKNIGAEFTGISFDAAGKFNIFNAKSYFFPGDEISGDGEKGWVTSVVGDNVNVINFLGLPYKPSQSGQSIKILRSGRRNIISANIGTISSTINPLNSLAENNVSGVLSASAQIFKEGWKTYCECFDNANSIAYMSKNPYVNGQKGVLRPYKAFAFLTDRTHTLVNSNTNIRKDGLYSTFIPFWQVTDGIWSKVETNWQWTTEITEYGPYGEELENKDALNRYSSAIFGYNHSLPIAVAANAKRRTIGYDGMEDYPFIKCSNDHFSYKNAMGIMLFEDAHTGKKSIKVNSGTIQITKPVGNTCNN